MKKSKIQWMTFFFTLVMAIGYYNPVEAKKAPNFWIRNLEGNRFDTRRHKGSFVISFFYVNCVPCIKEIPELHAMMSEKFPNSKLLFIDPVEEDSQGDIRNFAKISKYFKGADNVFHLAALADIVPSIENPNEYYTTNVTGTFNVLKASIQNNVKRFI